MEQERFDVMVFIGRFQPVHNGHLALMRKGLESADSLFVAIGSADRQRMPQNPFTAMERQAMILAAIRDVLGEESANRVVFDAVPDYYDDERWAKSVRHAVTSRFPAAKRVGLIGHYKDASSYYLDLFPQWSLVEMENQESLNSTDIRNLWLEESDGGNILLGTMVPRPVMEALNAFRRLPAFAGLQAEHKKIESDKAKWAGSPYAPMFVTVDAVVRCQNKILMVRRKDAPGKDQLALPGGFVNTRERLLDASLRELQEETGINLLPGFLKAYLVDKEVFDHPDRSSRGRTFSHGFFFDLELKKCPEVRAGDDAAEVMWVDVAELPEFRASMFEDHYMIIERFLT